MDTRHTQQERTGEEHPEEEQQRGIIPWSKRNSWLLVRLFMVLVFTFGASTVAANFSYGLQGEPVVLSAEEIREGRLPPGIELEDYVEIRGTPVYGEDTTRIGTEESGIALSSRYSTFYYYFPLQETGDNLLIQTAQVTPNVENRDEQVWHGKLATVGTTIFHGTTQEALEFAGLPQDTATLVIETGDTPEYYRQIFPAYAAIIFLWLATVGWLLWKRNKPFTGF
jgi:hypothetical protein